MNSMRYIATRILMCAFVGVITFMWFPATASAESEVIWGGQLRFRPEMRDNMDFDNSTDDNKAFIGNRSRLTANVKVKEGVTAKFTLQDVRNWGDGSQVSTGRESQSLDVFEGYFQIDDLGGTGIGLKAGRQTLVYGDQRLLGNLGWTDFARTHDAFKFLFRGNGFKADLFYAKEAETGRDSDEKDDDDLIGLYSTFDVAEATTLDLYFIKWKTGGGDIKGKDINTYGARMAADDLGGGLYAKAELVFQSGDWSEGVTHSANALSVHVGAKIDAIDGKVFIEYNQGSGDDNKNDNEHKAFTFPFHTNHGHYGYMDFFSWGNMKDIKIGVHGKPVKGWLVKLDYHIFSLAESTDDWYNVVGTKSFLAPVAGSDSTDAGTEIDLTIVHKLEKNFKVVGGYSIFQPGAAATDRSGGSDTSNWGYLMMIFNI